MGLATIDPHRKSTPRFTKLSLVFIRQVFTEIQRFKNFTIYKEMYGHLACERRHISGCRLSPQTNGHPNALSDSVRMAIHFFVNFDIFKWLYLAYYWFYLHQT